LAPKSERTRAAILNAALDFLWSHPFRDMTVNAVMASAGASRSAFYEYFGDPVAPMQESLTGLVRVS
jgi:AcrR family transcriptional regulator